MTTREPLILLVHRLPYPPNKGDKIRSWHLLRFLAGRYTVHLGAFVDDPADWAQARALAPLCASTHLVGLRRSTAALKVLPALATGGCLTVPWYRSASMARWVARTFAATGARRLVCFSAAMAQYANAAPAGTRRVLDMVDVDSDKWRQYGEHHGGARGWVYRREARRLLAFERDVAARFDATLLVTAAEAELFRDLAADIGDRVHAIENGVDTDYFDPAVAHDDPYPADALPIVFTGAMDYWANVDAVTWFAHEILPRVRAAAPEARFYIVGARPTDAVTALSALEGVEVTGAVADIRPWLAHARLAVAPLRVARGIQNKVLEAFAMARPLVATRAALDGLDLGGDYPLRADTPEELAHATLQALAGDDTGDLGASMRAWVRGRYDWLERLEPVAELLQSPGDVQVDRVTGAGERVQWPA